MAGGALNMAGSNAVLCARSAAAGKTSIANRRTALMDCCNIGFAFLVKS